MAGFEVTLHGRFWVITEVEEVAERKSTAGSSNQRYSGGVSTVKKPIVNRLLSDKSREAEIAPSLRLRSGQTFTSKTSGFSTTRIVSRSAALEMTDQLSMQLIAWSTNREWYRRRAPEQANYCPR